MIPGLGIVEDSRHKGRWLLLLDGRPLEVFSINQKLERDGFGVHLEITACVARMNDAVFAKLLRNHVRLESWTDDELIRGRFILKSYTLLELHGELEFRSCGRLDIQPRPVTAEIREAA